MPSMKNLLIIIFIAMITMNCAKKEYKIARKVNPLIGTGGHGHTYPGVSAPFGMVQLSPDTRVEGWDACSGYHYSDSTILGFSHTHLSGTGAADYGDILFTPRSSLGDTLPIPFTHDRENAWAGFYTVELSNNIDVALTSTTRVGLHKYNFKNANNAYLVIDLNHGIGPDKVTDAQIQPESNLEVSGFRRSTGWAKDQLIYFVAQFSAPFIELNQEIDPNKILLEFGKLKTPLIVKVGLSTVSTDNARENVEKETPLWDFDNYVASAEKVWNKELGKIKAEFIDADDDTIFYTALYHSFLAPNTFSDVNGEYRGIDKTNHTTRGTQYSVFSLWDTFRATHPLFTILNQQRNIDMINSMLNIYQQGGLLPVWELAANETGTMIGYHAIPVIADAIVKKLPGFDYELAFEAMQASASKDHLGLNYYREMGFIPAEKEHESVSKTLEYAYDDWCIAQTALALGYDDIYEEFSQRAQYYKNLYDPATGFMRPKRNGNWMNNFDPFEVSGNYTEANAWQYNLFVPHNISNLNNLYGPSTNLTNKLDSLFTASSSISGRQQPDIAGMIGQYAHGNEPSHNFAYLYNYVNQPSKTQKLVATITSELYKNSPDGLSGNEDCGQMSAWYVLSALGFYPVVPGLPEYALGTPSVKTASVKLESGAIFKIHAKNISADNYYVQEVYLNGVELNKSFITHEEIMKGGSLTFIMGSKATNTWHGKLIEAPKSTINASEITISPIIDGGEMTFLDSALIKISPFKDHHEIYFTVDGNQPTTSSTLYTAPFYSDTTITIKAIAVDNGKTLSKTTVSDFIKIPFGRKISLKNSFSHLYTGNSKMALIDHLHGSKNFRDGWQGFHQVNLEAIVDLGKIRNVNEVTVGFLQDHYSWIFYPSELTIELSTDGKSFASKKTIKNMIAENADGVITQLLGDKYESIRARYVRIKATNMGVCPDWHKGAGHPAWLFVDEINIETTSN